MRLVHACLRYPPATGGVETYVKELAERTHNIPKRDVRVLTSKLRTHGPISELSPTQLQDDPIYVQRLHHLSTPFLSYPRLQALNYYLKHHNPDIIHGYSFWYQPADVAARFSVKHRKPFIFHPIYYENKIRQKPIWQLYQKTIGSKTFAAADVVVVISPQEQALIEQANLPVKRFALISPGISIDKFSARQQNPFLKRQIIGPTLLTVSRLSEGKGLDNIIDALPDILRKSPNVQLAIAGENFGIQPSLERKAEQLGLSNHIHFMGRLTDPELIGAYQHATLFIHPSHYEAFGIVLAEALAAGLPVVARHTSAIPYVVPPNQAGLLFNNQSELSSHIIELLTNPKLGQKLANFGRHHVEKNFTWDQQISKLIKLYQELL